MNILTATCCSILMTHGVRSVLPWWWKQPHPGTNKSIFLNKSIYYQKSTLTITLQF